MALKDLTLTLHVNSSAIRKKSRLHSQLDYIPLVATQPWGSIFPAPTESLIIWIRELATATQQLSSPVRIARRPSGSGQSRMPLIAHEWCEPEREGSLLSTLSLLVRRRRVLRFLESLRWCCPRGLTRYVVESLKPVAAFRIDDARSPRRAWSS